MILKHMNGMYCVILKLMQSFTMSEILYVFVCNTKIILSFYCT